MADTLQKKLSERKVLGKEYSYEFEGYNLGAVPIANFHGKNHYYPLTVPMTCSKILS